MSCKRGAMQCGGGLEQLRQREAYLIALPLCIVGLDSSPVRAVAIEKQ